MASEKESTEQMFRKHVVALLEGKGAHAGFNDAVKNMPAELRGVEARGTSALRMDAAGASSDRPVGYSRVQPQSEIQSSELA